MACNLHLPSEFGGLVPSFERFQGGIMRALCLLNVAWGGTLPLLHVAWGEVEGKACSPKTHQATPKARSDGHHRKETMTRNNAFKFF